MDPYEEAPEGNIVVLRDLALRRAVTWATWPGATATVVTDAAKMFEYYLRTGDTHPEGTESDPVIRREAGELES